MHTPVVPVTSALTGIAPGTAFARKGAKIVEPGRQDDAGATLVAEFRAAGAEAEFVRADVRHEDDVRTLVDETVKRFGRLDIAVNAAGTEGKPGPAIEQTAESYAATFHTNVLGTILSMKHELRGMHEQGSGSIVTSPRPLATRVAPAHRFMRRASMPSRASPSRWHSKSVPSAFASTR